jgi:LAO/AO transport system kinase
LSTNKRKRLSVDEYYNGILNADRAVLGKAITLIESSLPADKELAQQVIEKCLPHSGNSIRVGITGVPGVGKSTFIEAFGIKLVEQDKKLCVLAIDPTSQLTGGSILGDKTRMQNLASHPNAFIRPSPSGNSLGGVTRSTRETVILCEAAGFDTVLIETVGVGQSETAVHGMVDFFLLLMLAGAGDELQGIKRGIMEMCDALIITKADGENKAKAKRAIVEYRNALHLYPPTPSGWQPKVGYCSAVTGERINEVWDIINEYITHTKENGYFESYRTEQEIQRLHETIEQLLKDRFYQNADIQQQLKKLEQQVAQKKISAYKAAEKLIR